ncbi:MAG: FCD domain-containing protein [Thermoflexales bacterium]|nr:FCD domain-containing protein [Thermoflexales bacterium]
MELKALDNDILRYLARHRLKLNGKALSEPIPALTELSDELGLSIGKLREQLEVARALGLVDVKPRTGIRHAPYDFLPAVRLSLLYALAIDPCAFDQFSQLRTHVEFGFWHEAVALLQPEDHEALQALMKAAWAKLEGTPTQIPHAEHRQLHLMIFGRLNNPFVHGILEAYWEAYEAVELNRFADYAYLTAVWRYHQAMVDAICAGDADAGHRALVEHTHLLQSREGSARKSKSLYRPRDAVPGRAGADLSKETT